MKADSKSRTERIGIAGTQLIFNKLGWIFREQPIEDYGIDAHVEVVESNLATGKLIALQIKSGKSYFQEKTSDGFVFRGDLEHLEYWQKHSLPVLVVLYHADDEIAYWQVVNSITAQKTDKAWKLIIPFNQKIDKPSLEKIQAFSKKLTSANGYTILSFKDVSHGGAKRYSANIILNNEYTKPDIAEIARIITIDLKTRQYYRNSQVKLHEQERETQIIYLFLYLSLDDLSSTNWICRTQWISENLSPRFSPIKLDGECIDDDIVVEWNKGYGELATIFDSSKLRKEDYLDTMNCILSSTKLLVRKLTELTAMFNRDRLAEASYLDLMLQLELETGKLYRQATSIGLAPTECRDLNQRFQGVMAFAHNIVLPFSTRGLEIWNKTNRSFLVDQAINDYQKELLRLEFELEKIH
jgi:Domain of unknown function (DUF4365)